VTRIIRIDPWHQPYEYGGNRNGFTHLVLTASRILPNKTVDIVLLNDKLRAAWLSLRSVSYPCSERTRDLIPPTLLPFLLLNSSSALDINPLTATDSSYTVHGILFGTFPFDSVRLVSNGSVSHGTLRTFGSFNGYSQDSFNYEPNYAYVGADSFTYHACDSSNNCIDGTINLNVVNNPPHAVADSYNVHGIINLPGDRALRENDTDPDGDPISVVPMVEA